MKKGVKWPNPRLADKGNGTVTDNLTKLIWLKNAILQITSERRDIFLYRSNIQEKEDIMP